MYLSKYTCSPTIAIWILGTQAVQTTSHQTQHQFHMSRSKNKDIMIKLLSPKRNVWAILYVTAKTRVLQKNNSFLFLDISFTPCSSLFMCVFDGVPCSSPSPRDTLWSCSVNNPTTPWTPWRHPPWFYCMRAFCDSQRQGAHWNDSSEHKSTLSHSQ